MINRRDFLAAATAPLIAGKLMKLLPTTPPVPSDDRFSIHRHRFGVNYTPTQEWFYFWNSFDASSVARDLDQIHDLGADHIRMFLLWPYFQPNPRNVSTQHLERLSTLMGLCRERGIDVQVSMLNGWLAFKAMPFYVDPLHPAAFYTDPRVLEAQDLYFREVSKTLKGHSNFLGFDIANEVPCCWSTGADTKTGDAWCERHLEFCEREFPHLPHVNGAWGHWFFEADTFSPGFMAKRISFPVIHCYPQFCNAPDKPSDPPSLYLAATTAALIRAYAGEMRKPVWCQEFGASTVWLPNDEIAANLTKTIQNGIDGGVSWFTWWCGHDLNPKFDFDKQEYRFGLLTHDGKPKPQAHAFREIARAYRGKEVSFKRIENLPLPPPPTDSKDTWKWLINWTNQMRG